MRSEQPFTRPADLDRHYENVHAPPEDRKRFECDYSKCNRSKDPFSRKDHYRDHLKDFHKEDIGRAKISKSGKTHKQQPSEKAQKTWLEERKIERDWWRCARCLIRININKVGWDCPSCKQACEKERVDRILTARSLKSDDETQYDFYHYSACSTCATGWVDDGNAGWIPCPNCQIPTTTSTEPDYYEYNSSSYNTYSSA